jgi:hypothetical protein
MKVVISLNEVSRAHVLRGGCGCISSSGWRVCAGCAEGFAAGDGTRRDDSAASARAAAAE